MINSFDKQPLYQLEINQLSNKMQFKLIIIQLFFLIPSHYFSNRSYSLPTKLQVTNLMGLIYFSQNWQLGVIFIQVICYINSYVMNLLVFKPDNVFFSLLFNLIYLRALSSLYFANKTHKEVPNPQSRQILAKPKLKNSSTESKTIQKEQNIQYCKHCKTFIQNRDHHCIYIGRCVEKTNYQYFFSYVLFSYILSFIGLYRLYQNQSFVFICWHLNQKAFIGHFCFSFVSHLFFVLFTGIITANSLRSIAEGIYVVDEIKQKKKSKKSKVQFVLSMFTLKGIKKIYKQFRENWPKMVGQDVTLWTIIFYLT